MDYKKKLKLRLNIAVIYILLGIIMIISTFIIESDNDFISTFGFVMIIMGLVHVRNYRLITKNDDTIRKQQIIEEDERSVLINQKARSAAFSIYMLTLCVFAIVLSFFNMNEAAKWLSYSVFLLVVIYWICYLVYQKKS